MAIVLHDLLGNKNMNIIKRLLKKEDLNKKWKKYFESRLPVSEAQQLMIKNDLLRQQANKMNDTISYEYFDIVARIRKNDYELSNYLLSNSNKNNENYSSPISLRIGK